MKLLNCDFVFFMHAIGHGKRKSLSSDWDGCFPRNIIIETISSKLGPRSKVLSVEKPVNLFATPVRHFSKFKRWISRKDILRNINGNLFVYLPHTFFPDSLPIDCKIVTLINRNLLKRQLAKIMIKYKFESQRRIVWAYHPFQIDLLDVVNEDIVVFECHDEYASSDEPIQEKVKNIIKKKEIELLKRADIVFTSSKLLHKNKGKYNLNTFFVPNAADVGHFRKAQDPDTKESLRIKGIKKPIIGYLGTIHHFTDVDLLTYAAEKRPDWSFVLIGPVDQKFDKTATYKRFENLINVYLLGWLDYDELPGIIKAFDVCVIPYKVDSEFNQNVNPNKLHEYTAMGKPIVSTDIPEVRSHQNIIKIAHDKDEFIDLIDRSIHEDNKGKIVQRLRIAEENSWNRRVDEMLGYIENALEKKGLKDREKKRAI
ncbi:glycosyltransferase [Thermodesulfobacteriota bacterium]